MSCSIGRIFIYICFYKCLITSKPWLERMISLLFCNHHHFYSDSWYVFVFSFITLSFLSSFSSRLSMQWACLSCRSASGKTLQAFYTMVSAVTSRPAVDSDVLRVTSVTPSSGSVWRNTRLAWHRRAHVRLAWASRRSWAGTPRACIVTEPKQAGSSSRSNTPGRSVQLRYLIMLWIIQDQTMWHIFTGGCQWFDDWMTVNSFKNISLGLDLWWAVLKSVALIIKVSIMIDCDVVNKAFFHLTGHLVGVKSGWCW